MRMTYGRRKADRAMKSRFFTTMLRAAGLTAYSWAWWIAIGRSFRRAIWTLTSSTSFLVILNTGGKVIYLDPGEKMCPFGTLNWKHAEASGIRESASGDKSATSPSPPYNEISMLRIGDLAIDAHGTVIGNLRFVMTGQEALHWRQEALLKRRSRAEEGVRPRTRDDCPRGRRGAHQSFLVAGQS